MKILAIRGKNLASLSNDFCVDFQLEPLASAGLFAITGATGSGKSTLLDALCLALYEKTPRLTRANAQGESIPDVGDNSVGPADPRTILRRGATEGFAEVDFLGSDAITYRARWSVRRARNKADGKLQGSEVTLIRLTDNQVLSDHRKSDTHKLIERSIGLSFEQFTRAVLLAQNDFAAFLKASDDDRAELLQTLTGTETFTQISKQAFARAKAENDKLKLLVLQLADHEPMTLEARSIKAAELIACETQLKTLTQKNTLIESYLRWHQQLDKSKINESNAASKLEQAKVAKEQAVDRIDQFALIEAVQPARPLHTEVGRLNNEISLGGKNLADSLERLTQAAKVIEDGKDAQNVVSRQLQVAEQARVEALPIIDQAKALDAQITALTPNYQQAVKSQNDAMLNLDREEKKLKTQHSELAQSQASLNDVQRWLVDRASLSTLAEGWQRWETLFAHASGLLRESRLTAGQCKELDEAEGALKKSLEKAGADYATCAIEHKNAAEKLDELSKTCAAFNPDELAKKKLDLETQKERISSAGQLWKTLGEQHSFLQQLNVQKQTQQTTLNECEKDIAQSVVAKPLLDRELAGAEKSLRIAELTASENVEQLRASLEPSCPCPVCGSNEHPYVQCNPQLQSVLAKLRENVQDIRKQADELLQRAASATARKQSTKKYVDQLDKDILSAAAALQVSHQEWSVHAMSEALQSVPDAERIAWFSDQQCVVQAGLAVLGKDEANYRESIRLKDLAQEGVTKAQSVLEKVRITCIQFELDHQRSDHAVQSARQKLIETENRLGLVVTELDTAFPEIGWREEWMEDSEGFVARCRSEVESWLAQRRQITTLSEKINSLTTSIQGAVESVANATQHLKIQTEQCQQLEQVLQTRQADRKVLLQGKTISEVEAASSAAIEAAKMNLAQRQTQNQKAAADFARIDEIVHQTRSQLEKNRVLLADITLKLTNWISNFNAQQKDGPALSQETMIALLAYKPEWIQIERQSLHALDNAISTAQAVLKEHQKALVDQMAEKPTEETSDALRDALTKTLAELEPAQSSVAALRVELARDDERQLRSKTLMAERESQAARTRIWSQLGDLIGSSDGKKFRNFAQQLTLDILLGYANRHLEILSRRYRLLRIKDSLGLLVVDQDMGDEVRSVHSLSGGESFLVSLALALGLASLSSHRVRVESLFIDEGFGSLDTDSLGVAMEALDTLHAQGRKVGVISHVHEMNERIGTRIQVKRQAGGQSRVVVEG